MATDTKNGSERAIDMGNDQLIARNFPMFNHPKVRVDRETQMISVLDMFTLVLRNYYTAKSAWRDMKLSRADPTGEVVLRKINGIGSVTPIASPVILARLTSTLLEQSRLPRRQKIAWLDYFQIQHKTDNGPPLLRTNIESETISMIRRCTACVGSIPQYTVEPYRVDLYFPQAKLAIECDEHGHRDRDPAYEAKRQNYVTAKLGCRWLRYNPHHPCFDIASVINDILCIFLTQATLFIGM